ncbi:MAG: hypothetical protein K0U78_03250 [Actinomycetia bacterium]|nr:hypothetical protein [Actinomycetes bacterium]
MTAMTTISNRLNASTDSLLRFAMRLDAALSGLAGIATVIFARQLAELSGTSVGVEYTIGVFFVAFAVGVLVLAARPAVRMPGLLLAIGNVLFTVATVVVVLAGVWPLTAAGVALVLGTGVYTLVMAELQYQGLRRITKA